jgi:SAM-dependent methyltransferase
MSLTTNVSPTAPLYTELPYPGDGVVRTTASRMLAGALRRHAPEILKKDRFYLADVGCGTGEATCGIAREFPNAVVVGLDINPASLKLARELAQRSRLNVSFLSANITNDLWGTIQAAGVLPEGQAFDVVVSMGVLHHLEDPRVGFAEIRRLVAATGVFMGFIYSRLGRWDDLAVKNILSGLSGASFAQRSDAVRALKLSNKHTLFGFLRNLRQRLKVGPPINLWEMIQVRRKRNLLVHLSDTYSNPCEHLYAFAELNQILQETGWSFVSLVERGGLPLTPAAHTRNRAALALLRSLPADVFYDYLAYYYKAIGFTFLALPNRVASAENG